MSQKGATATEYGLIAGLIAVVAMSAIILAGSSVEEVYCVVASRLDQSLVGGSGYGNCKTTPSTPSTNTGSDADNDNTSNTVEDVLSLVSPDMLDASLYEDGTTSL